jgi:hypothetical protein
VRKARAGPAGRSRETETQSSESFAVVTNGFLVDDEVEFSVAFDVLHPPSAFDRGIGLFGKCELHERQGSSLARKSSDQDFRIMRKEKVADDDAKRASAQRNSRLFERREGCITREKSLNLLRTFEPLGFIG